MPHAQQVGVPQLGLDDLRALVFRLASGVVLVVIVSSFPGPACDDRPLLLRRSAPRASERNTVVELLAVRQRVDE